MLDDGMLYVRQNSCIKYLSELVTSFFATTSEVETVAETLKRIHSYLMISLFQLSSRQRNAFQSDICLKPFTAQLLQDFLGRGAAELKKSVDD